VGAPLGGLNFFNFFFTAAVYGRLNLAHWPWPAGPASCVLRPAACCLLVVVDHEPQPMMRDELCGLWA
jgi:hypothetical protein